MCESCRTASSTISSREGRIYAARASRLLFTGQWLRAKGIRYLVHAFESLASRHPAIELTCLGTGARATLCGAIRTIGARAGAGVARVNREELAEELNRADIFVFPSLSEGFSGALLEAMASALPVVATAAGAAADAPARRERWSCQSRTLRR